MTGNSKEEQKCDSCIECNCMPCVCRCDCHKPSDMFKMENLEGE